MTSARKAIYFYLSQSLFSTYTHALTYGGTHTQTHIKSLHTLSLSCTPTHIYTRANIQIFLISILIMFSQIHNQYDKHRRLLFGIYISMSTLKLTKRKFLLGYFLKSIEFPQLLNNIIARFYFLCNYRYISSRAVT